MPVNSVEADFAKRMAQMLSKLLEGGIELLRRGITIWVIMFDVGHHGRSRLQTQEHTIVFIGFNHK